MAQSRRAFLRGVGGAAALSFVAGRGFEARAAPPRLRRPVPDGLLRLDSNENPNGPSPRALDAVREALGEAGRYPDDMEARFLAALAAAHGVPEDHVLPGCGSTEHLRLAVDAFASRGRWLVTAAPSFETPATYAAARGIPVVAVPVGADLGLDLGAMLDRCLGAGLVYVCNPNNPTATVHPRATLEDFVRRVLARAPAAHVLVDEAYFEYVDAPGHGTLIPLALEDPRVFVLRTFSKVSGLAGLRVGYAVGRPETMAAMAKFRMPLGLNVLGAAAALASLGHPAHLERERALNRAARDYTAAWFTRAGCPVTASATNFVMAGIGRPVEDFRRACAAEGVAVGRPFPPLDRHVRVSVGTMDEMRRAVAVFGRVLGTG
jgi:histidinol-phosphate aminotransferase